MHLRRPAALLGAICAACLLLAQESPGGAAEIRMTAQKYEFTPASVHVKAGQHVKLVITATDHDHGIKIESLHINQKLEKGKPTAIEFTPTEPGTFPFECSHFCGLGHKKMKGELIVE